VRLLSLRVQLAALAKQQPVERVTSDPLHPNQAGRSDVFRELSVRLPDHRERFETHRSHVASGTARVGFALVSFDSKRDTPAALADYRRARKLPAERWALLRGRPDDVLELAALLGIKFGGKSRWECCLSKKRPAKAKGCLAVYSPTRDVVSCETKNSAN
jgi:hypothetical protein